MLDERKKMNEQTTNQQPINQQTGEKYLLGAGLILRNLDAPGLYKQGLILNRKLRYKWLEPLHVKQAFDEMQKNNVREKFRQTSITPVLQCKRVPRLSWRTSVLLIVCTWVSYGVCLKVLFH